MTIQCHFSFEERPDGRRIGTCIECGRVVVVPPTVSIVHATCYAPQAKNDGTNPATLVWRYGVAVAKWIGAGRPVRTEDEVRRLESICLKCPKLRAGACVVCGCPISANLPTIRNKLAMETETCPLDKWG